MADEVMDDKQALSILDQMDLEQSQIEQRRGALGHMRVMLKTYQAAKAGLVKLKAQTAQAQAETANAEKVLAEMQRRVSTVTTQQGPLLKAAEAKEQEAIAKSEARTKAAADKIAALDAQVAEKEKFVVERSAQLDIEIRTKADQLTAAKAELAQFLAKHQVA